MEAAGDELSEINVD